MRKITVALLGSLLTASSVQAQIDAISGNLNQGPVYSVHGKLSTGFVESFKSGTPLYSDDWKKATLQLADGSTVADVPVRLNLTNGEVYYKQGSNEYVATSLIHEIKLKDETKQQELLLVNGSQLRQGQDAWFQLLVSGTSSLYKRTVKEIESSRQYSSATVERSIVSKDKYFILFRNVLQEVNKLRQVPEILFDKKEAVGIYIDKMKTSKLSDSSLRDIVSYYNSLSGQQ